jgi:hypothetical protein
MGANAVGAGGGMGARVLAPPSCRPAQHKLLVDMPPNWGVCGAERTLVLVEDLAEEPRLDPNDILARRPATSTGNVRFTSTCSSQTGSQRVAPPHHCDWTPDDCRLVGIHLTLRASRVVRRLADMRSRLTLWMDRPISEQNIAHECSVTTVPSAFDLHPSSRPLAKEMNVPGR